MRGVVEAVALILGAVLGLGTQQASAQFYIGGSAGGNHIADREANFPEFDTTTQTSWTNTERISMNTGFSGNVSIGYSFRYMRVEIEGGYARSTYNKLNFTGAQVIQPPTPAPTPQNPNPTPPPPFLQTQSLFTQVSGDMRFYSAALNVFFVAPTGTFVSPYIGGGVGGAREKSTVLTFTSGTFGNDHWTTNFLFQFEAGVDFNLGDHFVISPAFRYQQIVDDLGSYGSTKLYIWKIGMRIPF